MALTVKRERFAVRTVRDGQVTIAGVTYTPSEAHMGQVSLACISKSRFAADETAAQ